MIRETSCNIQGPPVTSFERGTPYHQVNLQSVWRYCDLVSKTLCTVHCSFVRPHERLSEVSCNHSWGFIAHTNTSRCVRVPFDLYSEHFMCIQGRGYRQGKQNIPCRWQHAEVEVTLWETRWMQGSGGRTLQGYWKVSRHRVSYSPASTWPNPHEGKMLRPDLTQAISSNYTLQLLFQWK